MNGTLQTTLGSATGFLTCLAVWACSTPPRSAPDATIATPTTTRPAVPRTDATADADAPPATSDTGDPDPLEALHDAEPVPVDQPELLRPHALRIVLDEANGVWGNVGGDPLLSEDGSIAIRLEDRSSFEAKRALVVLLVRELDHRERDRELIVVDSPDCRVSPNPPPCDFVGAAASAREVNAFLAKHKWASLRRYIPRLPRADEDCHGQTLARHFRAADYDFQFREPHLRIAQDDGTVVVDQNDIKLPVAPATCSKPVRIYIEGVSMDARRRVIAVTLAHCRPDRYTCVLPNEWLFFRLPKPAK